MTEREGEVDEYLSVGVVVSIGQSDLAVCTLLFQPSVICHYILFKTQMEGSRKKALSEEV